MPTASEQFSEPASGLLEANPAVADGLTTARVVGLDGQILLAFGRDVVHLELELRGRDGAEGDAPAPIEAVPGGAS